MNPKENPDGEDVAALRKQARRIAATLRKTYPEARTALNFRNPFELLVATILSAQCTDDKVNQVTPELFRRHPDARSLGEAAPDEIEHLIHATGFYRQKARAIQACARALAERHAGRVPESMEDLTQLPGVGRKTANLIRGCAMDKPALIVDTHVKRVVGRLGLSAQGDPDKIEADLARLLPEKDWTEFSNALIWHGRRICQARKPLCDRCPVLKDCDFGRGQGR